MSIGEQTAAVGQYRTITAILQLRWFYEYRHDTHKQYVASVRKRVVDIANEMLDGRTPFLEGSIKLSSLRPEAEIDQRDEDVMAFELISSETNDLPLGSAKEHWSVEALERLQPNIDKATEWAKKVGSSACQSLIRRFST